MNRFLVKTPEVRNPFYHARAVSARVHRSCCCIHKCTQRTPLPPPQNADFNQYWYSADTIAAIVGGRLRVLALPVPYSNLDPVRTDEVKAVGGRAAFISTPSLYFSLDAESRASCALLDVRNLLPRLRLLLMSHPPFLPPVSVRQAVGN